MQKGCFRVWRVYNLRWVPGLLVAVLVGVVYPVAAGWGGLRPGWWPPSPPRPGSSPSTG